MFLVWCGFAVAKDDWKVPIVDTHMYMCTCVYFIAYQHKLSQLNISPMKGRWWGMGIWKTTGMHNACMDMHSIIHAPCASFPLSSNYYKHTRHMHVHVHVCKIQDESWYMHVRVWCNVTSLVVLSQQNTVHTMTDLMQTAVVAVCDHSPCIIVLHHEIALIFFYTLSLDPTMVSCAVAFARYIFISIYRCVCVG